MNKRDMLRDVINQYKRTHPNAKKALLNDFWVEISYKVDLPEDFIREFKDNVDWYWISLHQTLSEDFIREFQDKVYWYHISWYQKLSTNFINEFKQKGYIK
jgi:hypothetical protein